MKDLNIPIRDIARELARRYSTMTHEELVNFARRYMNEMGYGQPGQPMLIYAHHDTDNNHIHIITSRVDPHGKKTYPI